MKNVYMLKYVVPAIFACLLIILPASSYSAEQKDYRGTKSIGAGIYYIAPANSVLDGVDLVFDESAAGGVNFAYYPMSSLSVEVSTFTYETSFKVGADDRFEEYGSFHQTALNLSALYHEDTEYLPNFRLHIGAGLGYYFNQMERNKGSDGKISDFFALNREITEIDNGMGAHGVLGFNYSYSDKLLFNGNVMISATEAKVSIRYPDSSIRETTLGINAIIFGAGLNYSF